MDAVKDLLGPSSPLATSGALSEEEEMERRVEAIERSVIELQQSIRKSMAEGANEEGLAAMESLQRLVREHYGADHVVYGSCLNDEGVLLNNSGRSLEAADRLIQALDVYRRRSGEETVSYAAAMHNLGLAYKGEALRSRGMDRVDMLDRSGECFEEALRLRRKVYDKGAHLEIMNTRRNLATVQYRRGKVEAAIGELRSVAEDIAESAKGPRHPARAAALNDLGFILKEAGTAEKGAEGGRMLAEALAAYEEALSIRTATLGELHALTLSTEWNLASLYEAMGDLPKQQEIAAGILSRLGVNADELDLPGTADPPRMQ